MTKSGPAGSGASETRHETLPTLPTASFAADSSVTEDTPLTPMQKDMVAYKVHLEAAEGETWKSLNEKLGSLPPQKLRYTLVDRMGFNDTEIPSVSNERASMIVTCLLSRAGLKLIPSAGS